MTMQDSPNYPPYTCIGIEADGSAHIYDDQGVNIRDICASRCFLEWWCPPNGYTWAWIDGIDPDDPATWPEDPAPQPESASTES